MKYKSFLSTLLVISSLTTSSQDVRQVPRNYGGFALVFDMANMSSAFGLEYERYLFTKNNLVAAVRANYIHQYKSGNSDISFTDWASGYHDHYDITLGQLWATGYVYTSSQKKYSGFFFQSGIGMTYSAARKNDNNDYGNSSYTKLLPSFEFGGGTQFPVSDRADFRGMLTASLSGKQDSPRPDEQTSLGLLSLKISIGF